MDEVLKLQPHLVPLDISVDGGGDSFIYKSELFIVMDHMLFACQDQAFSGLVFRGFGACAGAGSGMKPAAAPMAQASV